METFDTGFSSSSTAPIAESVTRSPEVSRPDRPGPLSKTKVAPAENANPSISAVGGPRSAGPVIVLETDDYIYLTFSSTPRLGRRCGLDDDIMKSSHAVREKIRERIEFQRENVRFQ